MKKKGFTLVELLVVIAIIALLMGILMPALARVRALAQQVVCGTHLSATGKALTLYANEHNGKYVRAGGRESRWGPTAKWNATPIEGEIIAFGPIGNNFATIGSHLYYLIKYADSTPKIFVCGGDTGASEFKLSDYPGQVFNNDLMEAWDFGPNPQNYYSYAYQCPFGYPGSGMPYFPLTSLSEPGMAIMADRNPYIARQADPDWQDYVWRSYPNGSKETEKWGNSQNHRNDGQNVLFNDGHVSFNEVPYCGVDEDNIYSMATAGRPVQVGFEPWGPQTQPVFGVNVLPQSRIDSVLINEGGRQGRIAVSGAPPPE